MLAVMTLMFLILPNSASCKAIKEMQAMSHFILQKNGPITTIFVTGLQPCRYVCAQNDAQSAWVCYQPCNGTDVNRNHYCVVKSIM